MTLLLFGIALVSLPVTYLCVGRYRVWAEKRRILDLPNERSAHTRPVARGGGIAIAGVTLLGVWSVFWLAAAGNRWQALLAYTLGALLIATVSWLDDLRSLPNWARFAAHSLGAAVALAWVGYWNALNLPLLGSVPLGWFGTVVTFVWIVGLTNAYNFMDGIDGIAGAQAVIAGLGWALLGWQGQEPLVAALGLLLTASSLGFLGYNWPPARLFMGDVGSAFLGYSFALLPLLYARIPGGRDAGGAPLLGALLVWPFLFDTAFTLLRRLCRRENVFAAHRTHLYQRLVGAGRSQRSVTMLYSVLALTGPVLGEVWSPDSAGGDVPGFLLVPLLCFGLWAYVRRREQQGRPNS
jgi:UDP-N-acetylmuramyl pentapeptide phosphotransferase/UDP-N-acetylglucosamine-1-phosphate transferase